jgi:hypothetical protein
MKATGERFALKSHSAQDLGRYDFLKDMARLEQFVETKAGLIGYAILLTNDSSYWKESSNARCVDASYRLHEGRTCSGILAWREAAAPGTIRNREMPIRLKNTYQFRWQDYSTLPIQSYAVFRALVVEVKRSVT